MRVLKYRKTAKRRNVVRHQINVERLKTRIAAGDTVRVMRGEDKGKEGKVLRVFPKRGRCTVEGVNIVKRHRKARRPEEQSGIIEMPAPIHLSNVMLLDPRTGAPTRIRTRLDEEGTSDRRPHHKKKERISVVSIRGSQDGTLASGDAIPFGRTR